MRRAPGGPKHFDELWMEQYYQIGYKFDIGYRTMGSELAKATVRAVVDWRDTKPGTSAAGKKCLEKYQRCKLPATMVKKNEKKE